MKSKILGAFNVLFLIGGNMAIASQLAETAFMKGSAHEMMGS